MNSSQKSSPEIEISQNLLSEMHSAHKYQWGAKPIAICSERVERLLGYKLLQLDLEAVKERATYHYQTASTYRGDQFFLERAICMGICDVANRGGKNLFRLTFPFIDILLSPKHP